MSLSLKCRHIVKMRLGAAAEPDFEKLVRLVDLADGQGPRIAAWDASYGAKPTDAELAALSTNQGYLDFVAAEDQRRLRPQNAMTALKAVVTQWHGETPAQTKARIDALDLAGLRNEITKIEQAVGKAFALIRNEMLD